MKKKRWIRLILLFSFLMLFVFLWFDQSEKQQLKMQSIPLTQNLFQEFQNDLLQGFICFSYPEKSEDSQSKQDIFISSQFKKAGSCKFLTEIEKQKISKLKWEIKFQKFAGQNFLEIQLSYLYLGKANIQEFRSFRSKEINPSSFAMIGLSSKGQDFQWNIHNVQLKIFGDTYLSSENLNSVTFKAFLPQEEDSAMMAKASKIKVVDYDSLGQFAESFRQKNVYLGSQLPVPSSSIFFSNMDRLSKWSLKLMPSWQKNAGFRTDEVPRSLTETCRLDESLSPRWLLLNQPKAEISLDLRQGTSDGVVCGSFIAPKVTLNVHGRVIFVGQIITENFNLIGDGELILIHPDHGRMLSLKAGLQVGKSDAISVSSIDQNWQGFLRSYGSHLSLPFDSEGWNLSAKDFWSGRYDFDSGAWSFHESRFLNFWIQTKEVR